MGKKRELIDTNILVRYLTGDDPEQLKVIKKIFMECKEGKRDLILKPLIVAETCFVLETHYIKTKENIAESFEVILSQKWLKVVEREILLNTIKYYSRGIHFADAYLIAYSRYEKMEIFTFDKKLLKEVRGVY